MTKLLTLSSAFVLLAGAAEAQTINILMESVPDTRFVEEVLPQFTEATGIDVELEVVNYAEMHTKLVPQLVAPTGSYDVIVVDFYWVGEFTKAGWLQPLDDRIKADGFDTSVYFDSLMNLVGKVDGVDLHAALLQLRHGPHLSQRPGERSGRAGGVQGEIRHRAAGPRDLGRVHEAGRVLHPRHRRRRPDRLLRRGQPGSPARSDRDGVVELPLRQQRPVL